MSARVHVVAGRVRAATHETFESLHVRNFRLFFVGQGITQTTAWPWAW
jgi:hypothetical protein